MQRDSYFRRTLSPCLLAVTNVHVACFCFVVFFVSVLFLFSHRVEHHSPPFVNTGRTIAEWFGDDRDSQAGNSGGAGERDEASFTNTVAAFRHWDARVGCAAFRGKQSLSFNRSSFLQNPNPVACSELKQQHVSVLVKEYTWIPDSLNSLYSCGCGLTCLWEKSSALVDEPDAHLYEMYKPPHKRSAGHPLRVFMDLEPQRLPASQDIFVSYHHEDTLQATYAGSSFHSNRNYYISTEKRPDVLVYWSSSRCLKDRQDIARSFLPLVPHHSFGSCLNNVGGRNVIDKMYSKCQSNGNAAWSTNIHCGMSHYKFALAIENTFRDSYVTEKLFYALDAGTVPIYFGAPNVLDLVPPNSIILGNSFNSMEELAIYVKRLARDPVKYAEYHAWRRCGVIGNYRHTRAVSLDSLPCRVCATVSRMGGRNAPASSH